MMKYVFNVVEETGKPDPWIVEVGRARERGSLSPGDAEYLIVSLASFALTKSTRKHPVLSKLSARMRLIEREDGSR